MKACLNVHQLITILCIVLKQRELWAAVPQWVYRTKSCPMPNNLTAWMKASERLNCLNSLRANSIKELKHVYHCMPSSYLNESLEFCSQVTRILNASCAVYSYFNDERPPNYTPNSKSCSAFRTGCPLTEYFSNTVYKYKECFDFESKRGCYSEDPNCDVREESKKTTMGYNKEIYLTTESLNSISVSTLKSESVSKQPENDIRSFTSVETVVLAVFLTLCAVILAAIAITYVKKRREKMKDAENATKHQNGSAVSIENPINGTGEESIPLVSGRSDTCIAKCQPGDTEQTSCKIPLPGDRVEIGQENERDCYTRRTKTDKNFQKLPVSCDTEQTGQTNQGEDRISARSQNEDKKDDVQVSCNTKDTAEKNGTEDRNTELHGKRRRQPVDKRINHLSENAFLLELFSKMSVETIEKLKILLKDPEKPHEEKLEEVKKGYELYNFMDNCFQLSENFHVLQAYLIQLDEWDLERKCYDFVKSRKGPLFYFHRDVNVLDGTRMKMFLENTKIHEYDRESVLSILKELSSMLNIQESDIVVEGFQEGSLIIHLYVRKSLSFILEKRNEFSIFLKYNVKKIYVENNLIFDENSIKVPGGVVKGKSLGVRTIVIRRVNKKELDISKCDKCRLLRATCYSKESIEFWNNVAMCGGNDKTRCHSKFWLLFVAKLKETFPGEDGLNSKQTIHLLKTLMNVENGDDSEITLTSFVRAVRFFGPFRKDDDGKCHIIQHLNDIVKRSLVKSPEDRKKKSWFAGDMDTDVAEKTLMNERNKTYLIRMNQNGSDDGNFVLSVIDANGLHHFEIEGNPEDSSKSASLDCHLNFFGKTYKTLPDVIEELKYRSLKDEDDDEEVQCLYICPNLPLNSVITPYHPSHDALVKQHSQVNTISLGSLRSAIGTEEKRQLYERQYNMFRCYKCKMLRATCFSKETIEFWDNVDMCGGNVKTRCHSKFWALFLAKLKRVFQNDDALRSQQTIDLLKRILNVQNADDDEITLTNLVKIIRFFGPFKKDTAGKCIIIHHLSAIVKRSLLTSEKEHNHASWFAGDMDTNTAEKLLANQRNNTYLVRMSQFGSENGNFVVSVKDKNGLHHFEIQGNPEASCKSTSLDCHLKFFGKTYRTLPDVVEELKYRSLKDEEDDEEVQCLYICPDLPLNTVLTPIKPGVNKGRTSREISLQKERRSFSEASPLCSEYVKSDESNQNDASGFVSTNRSIVGIKRASKIKERRQLPDKVQLYISRYNLTNGDETCDKCNVLRGKCPSRESLLFWDEVPVCGRDAKTKCHSKFWAVFLAKLKVKFPNEYGLYNRRTIYFMKTLLNVQKTDDAEIKLASFVRFIRFFGPFKSNDDGKCVLINHVNDIVKRSLIKFGTDHKKASWFAGAMTTYEAEKKLVKQKNNTYLVRMNQSVSENGNFVVSVKDKNGLHHFEVRGNHEITTESASCNFGLEFLGKTYKTLPDLVEELKYTSLKEDDNDEDVWCINICPNLQFNSVIAPYESVGNRDNRQTNRERTNNILDAFSQIRKCSKLDEENIIYDETSALQDVLVMQQACFYRDDNLKSTAISEMKQIYVESLYTCDKCKLLKVICSSKDTIEFWDDIAMRGENLKTKCHSKFWELFQARLKEKFPCENYVYMKQTMNLLKKLLDVPNADDAEISLTNLVRIVRFLGPFKKDVHGKCIIINHLNDIVKESLGRPRKDSKKISWFAGDMTREDAEKILMKRENETFLVRMSQSGSDNGNFSLSAKDGNKLHHFEIEGNPEASSKSASLDCHLKLFGKTYRTLPDVVKDLKYRSLKDEDDDDEVQCLYICPDLPFNAIITPNKRTRVTNVRD